MTKNYEIDRKICPKCSEVMHRVNASTALPTYIGSKDRKPGDRDPAISVSDVWTVEMYTCPKCRFVELYAD
jgi:Zn-finger nucleic acid-binding protein